ncbi:MAG: hypothetical protein WB729_06185 [Candidatus Sulfotelmatobacter sp.]
MRRLLLPVAASLCLMLTTTLAQAPESSLLRILTNQTVFGKDFSAVLRSLPAWNSNGEHEVVVFAHQVVAATRHDTRQEAQKGAAQLNAAFLGVQSHLKSEYGALAQAASPLHAEAIAFPEDGSYRVAVADSSWQLLSPELTLERLKKELGAPQKVAYVTVQNKTERRPIQLTLYEYADGQVAFAIPDLSLHPGIIDRVLLNVRAISAAAFQEAE